MNGPKKLGWMCGDEACERTWPTRLMASICRKSHRSAPVAPPPELVNGNDPRVAELLKRWTGLNASHAALAQRVYRLEAALRERGVVDMPPLFKKIEEGLKP